MRAFVIVASIACKFDQSRQCSSGGQLKHCAEVQSTPALRRAVKVPVATLHQAATRITTRTITSTAREFYQGGEHPCRGQLEYRPVVESSAKIGRSVKIPVAALDEGGSGCPTLVAAIRSSEFHQFRQN